VITILFYSDVLSLNGWDIAVACAIYIRIFIVVLHSPYKKIIEKVQYVYFYIAITSSFQILHYLLLSYLI